MNSFRLLAVSALLVTGQALSQSAAPAPQTSTAAPGPGNARQVDSLMLGYKHLDERIKTLETQRPSSLIYTDPEIRSQIRDLQVRLQRSETMAAARLQESSVVAPVGQAQIDSLQEELTRVTQQEKDLRDQFLASIQADEPEVADAGLGRRVRALEKQLEGYSDTKAQNEILTGRVKDLQEANALLINRVNEQMEQVQELIAVARGTPPPQPQAVPVMGAKIDSGALMRSAREASRGKELAAVNCSALSADKEKDWALATRHALPTHRFIRIDREAEVIWTLAPSGESESTAMTTLLKAAGC